MRIQELKARVGASTYAVDVDAVAGAIVERLVSRASALAAGRAALDVDRSHVPRLASPGVLKTR